MTSTPAPTPIPAPISRAQRRSRSRAATRSAVLTVALPSVAGLGVFAVAAVVSTHPAIPHQAPHQAPPPAPPTPVAKEVTARADRTEPRVDLARPQETDQRVEKDVRPRFALPVDEHGLSATYGEAGSHWAARHTGIDFPVPRGTPVHAVTDGTVSTRWNPAYGYMAAVTAPDGTLTWYCHLGSYRVRKGQVRAGDVIAYSGSSGNSTGPHLHFEVHPDGTGPVDPLPWLLAHGLDPR